MRFKIWTLSLPIFLCLFSGCGGGGGDDAHEDDIDWMAKENMQPSQHQNLAEEEALNRENRVRR